MALNEDPNRSASGSELIQGIGSIALQGQRIVQSNPRAVELLGIEDLTGRQLFELLVPESWNEVRIAIEQGIRGVRQQEPVVVCLKEANTWLHATVAGIDSSGEVTIHLQPLSGQGASDGEGAASRDHFYALVKNSSEGFTIFNENADIVYESPANKRIHGYDAHEVMGRNLFDFCVKEDRERIMPLFVNLEPGGRATGTVRFRHKDGHYVYLEGTIHHQIEHPSIRGIINNFRDISDRIEAESELRRAKEAAEHAIEVQKRFLANISHELKTPLTLIREPLSDLRKEAEETAGGSRTCQSLWPLVERNLDQLDRLITELLDLSQLEAGLFKLQAHQLDLAGFTRDLAAVFAPAAKSKGIDLLVDLPAEAPAFFDSGKIEKAIRNLLANAIKFTESGGRISVRMSLPEGGAMNPQYVIEVEDTGCGMDEMVSQRAFDRFFQADSGDSRQYEGMGIGLALARAMIRMHGGELLVRSQPGVGSTFVLTLPVGCWHLSPEEIEMVQNSPSPQPAANPSPPPAVTAPGGGDTTGAARRHLLLVEDNPDMRSYLAHHLSETFDLSYAGNGREALDRLDQGDIDLVLSDVMMPSMDGLELCRNLRGKKHLAKIPLVLLSAKNTGEDRSAGLEAGAADFISKPFFMPEVVLRIQRLLAGEDQDALHPADRAWLDAASANLKEILSVPDLTVEDMARVCGLSPDHFEGKLQTLTGQSARTFLRNLRLKRAHRLLREQPDKPLETIASEVGMTVGLLRRAYRSHFGMELSGAQGRAKPS